MFLGNLMKEMVNIGKELLPPRNIVTSLLGSPTTWLKDPLSEFRLYKNMPEAIQTVAALSIQRTFPLRDEPTSIPRQEEDTFRDESWFFINGIATTVPILRMNGEYFKELFGRPLELISNPSDGVFIDLFECVFGRSFDMSTKPAEYATSRIDDAITSDSIKKVVLLCHSQGGIIASNVVKNLIKKHRGKNVLKKLEVYTFGCAADEFEVDRALSKVTGRLVPYVEHYANLGDVVARVGVLQKQINVEDDYFGEIYEVDKQGHLLNAHYLPELKNKNYTSKKRAKNARLYGYLESGSPEYFNPLPEDL